MTLSEIRWTAEVADVMPNVKAADGPKRIGEPAERMYHGHESGCAISDREPAITPWTERE
jgi:hypothetical protein